MSKKIENIEVELDENLNEKLELLSPGFTDYRIIRESIDARKKSPHFVYAVEVYFNGEKPTLEEFKFTKKKLSNFFEPISIIGAGPAGLFAALRLTERGIPCRVFERGSEASKRMRAIAEHWRYGKLEPNNNVCFGEGGAGLYSDGKLITRIKSPHIPYVMDRLVRFGAPEEIRYLSNPHVGSDKIRKVIPIIREYLKANGVEFYFDSKVKSLSFDGDSVNGLELENGKKFSANKIILASGHSATDMLMHLHENGVTLEGKSFAIGLRIEHPQNEINLIQYGEKWQHPKLGAANYRLADHDNKTGIGVYSFCMCPGGYVIASSTEDTGVVCNGMSNFARNSPYANAAVVMSIDHAKLFGTNLFGGLEFRKVLEEKAKQMVIQNKGAREFPAQKLTDFLAKKTGELFPHSSPSGAVATPLHELFDQNFYNRLCHSLERFNYKMKGFVSSKALLFGVESRTSCPIRVPRNPETLQSVSHNGLYPAGEGAGYAGGITSAAVDGVKIADAIADSI